MPKLLNINNYHYRRGGADVVYLEHAAQFEKLGWFNAYFSMQHPSNLPTPWSSYFIDELEFGQAYSLGAKIGMASKVVYSFEAQRKLRALLKTFKPDLAHLHCIYHHLSPAILPTLKAAGIPAVMTAHDLKIACPAYKMLNSTGICERCKDGSLLNVVRYKCVKDSFSASLIVAMESGLHKWLSTYKKYLDKIIVPSLFLEKKFAEWGWPASSFKYIPNYVDAQIFVPQYQPGNSFLYFGRLTEEKGLRTLVRAVAQAGTSLNVVGTGPLEAEIKSLVRQLGAKVEFLGYQTGNDLHAAIRAAKAVILPSEIYENAPMSILEAYALGKPVIAADIGGLPELVQVGRTGWIFKSGSVDQLSSTLCQVLATPEARLLEMGCEARQHVESHFSRQRYMEGMLELYASLGVASPAQEHPSDGGKASI